LHFANASPDFGKGKKKKLGGKIVLGMLCKKVIYSCAKTD
jgi:hypothetical protein